MPESPVPKAPRIVNVAALKTTPRPGTLIHFTEEQWKGAVGDIPVGKALPKYGVRLAYYPLPDGGGAVQGECVQDPCEVCRMRMTFDPQTGEIRYQCLCRPDPRCPSEPQPSVGACVLVINAGPRIRIGCSSTGCTGRCRLTLVRQGTRYLITCACGR